jgi:hypothetical protein
VRIDSVKVSGYFSIVYLKYFNANGAGAFSYQSNFGPLGQVNLNSSHVKTVLPGTAIDSIWCYLSGGFNVGQNYDFRVTFFSPVWAQSPTKSATSVGSVCAVSASVNTSLICLGGSATLTATGTAGMSYSWTPGTWLSSSFGATVVANPLTTTTYTVIGIDQNNCSDTSIVVVNVSSNFLNLVVSSDTTICLGDTVILRASGATTYQWSPGGSTADSIIVSPTLNGTYTVTGTNSTCSTSKQVVVQVVFVKPVVFASTDTVCLNGIQNVLLSTSIPGGVWSPHIFNNVFDHTSAGVGRHSLVYTLTTSQGCVGKDTVYVVVLDTPSVSSWHYDNVGNLILNGSFPYNILMTVNGTTYVPSAQNSTTVVFSNLSLSQGELVIIKSQGGDCFVLFYFTSTNAETELDYEIITVYPNPCKDILNIKATSIVGEMLKIFNTHGQEVRTVSLEGETSVDMSGLPSGVYYARLGTSNVVKILRE